MSAPGPGARPPAWRAAWSRPVARSLFSLLYAVESAGADRVPRAGPVILAANHTGYLDGPLLVALSPRDSHVLVYDRSFVGIQGVVLRATGQIPLDQRVGDRAALGAATTVLAGGGVVGIFPEGGRGRGDVTAAAKGVAWLALRSGGAVVPVACLGTRETGEPASSWPPLRRRLVADFGDPVDVSRCHATDRAGVPGRVRLERAAETLRTTLAAHVAAASRRHGIPLPEDVPPDLMD